MAHPVEEFETYRKDLLAELGGDDPTEVMRSTLAEIKQLVAESSREELAKKASPEVWSAHQTLLHLADTDLVYGVRLRMMLTQTNPVIVGYDQEAWVNRFSSLEEDPFKTYDRWRAVRESNLGVLASLSEDDWKRVGIHTERGEESVRMMIDLLGGHDRTHLTQFRRAIG